MWIRALVCIRLARNVIALNAAQREGGMHLQVFRKRGSRLQPCEEEEYIRFLTWTFELGTRAAALHGQTRWVAILDMKGYALEDRPFAIGHRCPH